MRFKEWTMEERKIMKEYYPNMGYGVLELLPNKNIGQVHRYAAGNKIKCNGRPTRVVKEKYSKYHEYELECIRECYPPEGPEMHKRIPPRTKASVKSKAYSMNIHMEGYVPTKRWSEEEKEIVRKYYAKEGTRVLERLPGRSLSALYSIVNREGLRENAWTKKEKNIITKYYGEMELGMIAQLLPGKSLKEIKEYARGMGLISYKENRKTWTAEEVAIVEEYFPVEGLKCNKRLRFKTITQVQEYAKANGIENPHSKRWTDNEINIMLTYYPTEGGLVVKRLPGRSRGTVYAKANKLNLVVA